MDTKPQVNFLEDFSLREIELPQENEKKGLPRWLKIFFVILIASVVFFSTTIFSNSTSLDNTPGGLPKIGLSQLWTAFKGYVLGSNGNLEGQKEDRINILLMGMGGVGHEGPFLTDTMIIASIKPSTGQVAMISIPRDLYVPITNYGWMKINHANSIGETDYNGQGGKIASETISNVLNIPIHYYARIDFAGFEKIIDDLGGIEVTVDNSFTDAEYPAPEFLYQVVSFEAGKQKMNGDVALKFVRSRHGNNGEGSDFARSQRQQKVIMAVKDKALSLSTIFNPAKISKMLKTLDSSISTDLTANEIIYLSKFVENFSMSDIISYNFNDAPDNFLVSDMTADGAYILRPKAGNFNQMSDFINNVFNQVNPISETQNTESVTSTSTPASTSEEITTPEPKKIIQRKINITVLNGTKIPGLAGKSSTTLNSLGFEIIKTTNSPQQDYEKSVLYQVNQNEDLSEAIKKIRDTYQVNVSQDIPENLKSFVSENLDFILVIGPDNS